MGASMTSDAVAEQPAAARLHGVQATTTPPGADDATCLLGRANALDDAFGRAVSMRKVASGPGVAGRALQHDRMDKDERRREELPSADCALEAEVEDLVPPSVDAPAVHAGSLERRAGVPLCPAVGHAMLPAVILLDWDDSLFPTSWFERAAGYCLDSGPDEGETSQGPEDIRRSLKEATSAVLALLLEAATCGDVAVVTLAERPWVQESVTTYMPDAAEATASLDVCYARELPPQPSPRGLDRQTERKRRAMEVAFEEAMDRHGMGARCRSLISIGDSHIEARAAEALGQELAAQGRLEHTKTVKLMKSPGPQELMEQSLALCGSLRDIVNHPGDGHFGPGFFSPAALCH
mmetsp:Transcript_29467/g.84730  ORF Transcript_29467/g.84730 Transcript_29467/m.84730 type:complete len:351 (+) Transcript_29467:100-1152(+)